MSAPPRSQGRGLRVTVGFSDGALWWRARGPPTPRSATQKPARDGVTWQPRRQQGRERTRAAERRKLGREPAEDGVRPPAELDVAGLKRDDKAPPS